MGCGVSSEKKYDICETSLISELSEKSDDMTTRLNRKNDDQETLCEKLTKLKLFKNIVYVSKKRM